MLGRSVYADPSHIDCVSVAKDWLHTCLTEHKRCDITSKYDKPLPTRVIDVGDEATRPKLTTTSGENGTYIALSYCWGGGSTFVHNDETAKDLENGISLEDYPATLRDAIIATRALGIRYIWIDALCIKQDSPQDWASEAAKMHKVYSDAILTIIAANSPTTRSGIFTMRSFELKPVELKWKSPAGSRPEQISQITKVYLRSGSELWDDSLQSSVLQTRGWTLQEGVLAPRTLAYGSQQMIWECAEYQADEGGRITRATQDYRSKAFMQQLIRRPKQETAGSLQTFLQKLNLASAHQEEWWKSFSIANPYDKWNDIAKEFMARSLTKDTDILPAIGGIARIFQRVLDDEYCAGLWKKDLLCSLLWNRSPRYPADQSTRFELVRPSEYLAPSWSWASILGRTAAAIIVNWKIRDALKTSADRMAKIIGVHTIPKGEDLFGQVVSGELVLQAPYSLIDWLPPAYTSENEWLEDFTPIPYNYIPPPSDSAFQRLIFNATRKVDVNIWEFYQQHKPHKNQHFAIIEIVRWNKAPGDGNPGMNFLLLESTGRKEGEYRRIGEYAMGKSVLPNPDDVPEDAYAFMVLENEAYEEVVKAKWRKKTVTII